MVKLKEEKAHLEENFKQLEKEIEANVEIAPYKYKINEKTKKRPRSPKIKRTMLMLKTRR